MEKNIWIINQYASHLETRHLELARVFAENGYTVTVITSSYHHGKREYLYPETLRHIKRAERINYVYLKAAPEYRNNGVKRAFSWFGFCLLFMRKLKDITDIAGKPAFVIASSAPPTVWELGLHCAKKFGAKFIAEFRDIWPLSLVEIQGVSKNHPAVFFFSILEKRAYRKSDAIVATMPYAHDHVVSVSGVPREKVHWMANGINTQEVDRMLKEADALPAELDRCLEENWCAVYTGSIAKCENVDYLVESFKALRDPSIHLAIIGEGGYKENIQALINESGLENIHMFDAVNREQIPQVLEKAGCCVAAIEDLPLLKYGLSKYKLSDYLYSGRPTIFACNGKNVVKDAGHFSVPFGDVRLVADAIEQAHSLPREQLEELGAGARALIQEKYDYSSIGKSYLEMMEAL